MACERWELPKISDVNDLEGMIKHLEELKQKAADEGFKDGYDKGHDEGYKKGYQTGEEAVNVLKEKLKSIEHIISQPIDLINEEVDEAIVHLVKVLCANLLEGELSKNPDELLALIKKAKNLLTIDSNQKSAIHLNPTDFESIDQSVDDLFSHECDIVKNEKVAPGGCVIKNGFAHVDASLQTRIAQLFEKTG